MRSSPAKRSGALRVSVASDFSVMSVMVLAAAMALDHHRYAHQSGNETERHRNRGPERDPDDRRQDDDRDHRHDAAEREGDHQRTVASGVWLPLWWCHGAWTTNGIGGVMTTLLLRQCVVAYREHQFRGGMRARGTWRGGAPVPMIPPSSSGWWRSPLQRESRRGGDDQGAAALPPGRWSPDR